jgi:flavin-dependent dehydrogenase
VSSRHDILIAGASFAGLTAALHLARAGKGVFVAERKKDVGEFLHTSGILTQDALGYWSFPKNLLHPISHVRLYNRHMRHTSIKSDRYFFHANDTPALLRWMAEQAVEAGATLATDTLVKDIRQDAGGVIIDTSAGTYSGHALLAADGALSKVAARTGLSANTRFLAGVEHEYENIDLPRDIMHVFIDPVLAPGYIAWLMPGVKYWQAGLAGHRGMKCDMAAFMEKIGGHLGFSAGEPVERRSGVIPINGRLKNIVKDRILLLGDAAGLVSPLTAGGIHYGMESAMIAARHMKDCGPSGYPGALENAAREFPSFRFKHAARAVYDWPLTQHAIGRLVGSRFLDRMAENVFFHH